MENIEMLEKAFADDNLDDLYELYCRVDKEVEKKKGQRITLVSLGYFAVCTYVIIAVVKPSSLATLLGCLLSSAFISIPLFWINFSALGWLIHKNLEDNERRDRIELRIKLAQKRQQPKQ